MEKLTLYHGTTAKHLDNILANGIRPRNTTGTATNWEENPSPEDRVYVTDAYAVYYAWVAARMNESKEKGLILKVELDLAELIPDEDAMVNIKTGDEFIDSLSTKKRNEFWKLTAPMKRNLAKNSLEILGTAAHMGAIPPEKIVDHRVFEITTEIIIDNDPSIVPMHYAILGDRYRKQCDEIFTNQGGT